MHRNVPGTDLDYHLVSLDKHGAERSEDDGLVSDTLATLLKDRAHPVSDVFLLSHGWKGDVPAAIAQCDAWLKQMADLADDRAAIRARRPGFRPLIIGLHWPSLPWGDEALGSGGASRLLSAGGEGLSEDPEALAQSYAEVLGDTPRACELLQRILALAPEQDPSAPLAPELVEAYQALRDEIGLDVDEDLPADAGAASGAWDPAAIHAAAMADEEGGRLLGGGGRVADAVLSPLRQMSFWRMKRRAREVGETGGAALLRKLQAAAPADTRFHLMGHSFGCIVVSATVAGPPSGPAPAPVHSLLLVQGALSLWSYCADVDGVPGYFHRIVRDGRVRGPIVTTRTIHDHAVGRFYPMGAGIAGHRTLADLPKYGGAGAFGLHGPGIDVRDLVLGDVAMDYAFVAGRVCNVEASTVIRHGDGASGAHSDIAHPEVAHLAWQAILAGT